MMYAIVKVVITSVLIVAIAEISKRSSLIGALLASLPLVSILAMLWLYIETKEIEKVSALASSVFWLVLPSLVFFVCLPLLLRKEIEFYLSMGISMSVTAACYFGMIRLLLHYGIKL